MSNEVVISLDEDFHLDKRDDCLMFDGVDDRAYTPNNPTSLSKIRVEFYNKTVESLSNKYLIDTSNGTRGFLIRRFGTGIVVFIYDDRALGLQTANSNVIAGLNTLEILVSGSSYTVNLNGVIATQNNYNGNFVSGTAGLAIGDAIDSTPSPHYEGQICCVEIEGFGTYIQNGDFGDATLIDHSGNGNDCIIVGPQWWKLKVDQHFQTAQLFKSQLPLVPVEFQNVVDIKVGIPPTGDAFWEAYTKYWLRVSYWWFFSTAQFLLLLNKSGGRMPVIDRTTGTEILAIQTDGLFEFNPVPIQISASTEVTFDVVLVENLPTGKLTPLKTVALETFYEYGKIGAIDLGSVVGDLNTVIFGITT